MLEKKRVAKKIEIDLENGTTAIEWRDQILEDGNVVYEVPHRRAFSKKEKADLEAELPEEHKVALKKAIDDIDAKLPLEDSEKHHPKHRMKK